MCPVFCDRPTQPQLLASTTTTSDIAPTAPASQQPASQPSAPPPETHIIPRMEVQALPWRCQSLVKLRRAPSLTYCWRLMDSWQQCRLYSVLAMCSIVLPVAVFGAASPVAVAVAAAAAAPVPLPVPAPFPVPFPVPASVSVNQTKSNQMRPTTKCEMSEYTCTSGKCIALNKFCDKVDNCGDGSDEPRFCTPCNRTYYGNLGITYPIELHRPKEDKIPYVCVLTFTAAGGSHGDIVQVTLESFTLGRFVSYTQDGCPDGFLQINEASRIPVGGMWCGTSWGPVMFYSETRSLIMTIKLFKLAKDQSGYNFDFRLQYKVLSRESAVVRYGGIKYEEMSAWFNETSTSLQFPSTVDEFTNATNTSTVPYMFEGNTATDIRRTGDRNAISVNGNVPLIMPTVVRYPNNFTEPKYYMGELIDGTYCSRIFSDCDKKPCRLQSPNYPGVYPRNLTCYYAVRQHEVPPGKHALITVRQAKGNLVWISTQSSSMPSGSGGSGGSASGGTSGGTSGGSSMGGSSGTTGTGTIKKTSSGDRDKFQPKINTWNECDQVQVNCDDGLDIVLQVDYVTIYDGYTTRDPVILKFCGGGQSVPPSISSGPELLVEFITSPFGTFVTSQPNVHALQGFQLEVDVRFIDIESPLYSKNKRSCEFWILGNGHGTLRNPEHSLGPNTTCLYHLQGTDSTLDHQHMRLIAPPRRSGSSSGSGGSLNMLPPPPTRFRVWLSIVKFDLPPRFGYVDEISASQLQPPEDCDGMLRVWDGPLREPPNCRDLNCERDMVNFRPGFGRVGANQTNLIARYCRGTLPKTCDHGSRNESLARPCGVDESFVSTGDFVTLEVRNTETTVLRPLSFQLRYEFVDLQQDGVAIAKALDCNRRFVSNLMEKKEQPGTFRSAKNVFLFGRGGARNLKCVYRFEAQRGDRVRIVLRRVLTGRRQCASKLDADINRSYCYGDIKTRVEIYERPWQDSIPFLRGCICNSTNTSDLPIVYTSTSREVELHLIATNMTSLDDPDTVQFEGLFEFIRGPLACTDSRRKSGSSGSVSMSVGDHECRTRPWLMEPAHGKYLYVRLAGTYLRRYNPSMPVSMNTSVRAVTAQMGCATSARVVVTTGEGISVTACPMPRDSGGRQLVEVFSAGWSRRGEIHGVDASRAISVEFLEPDNGDYMISWLELSPTSSVGLLTHDICLHRCPELDACVNSSVWCDGIDHCPSGYDESFTHCSALLRLPIEILGTLLLLFLLFLAAFVFYVYRKLKRHFRRDSVLQTRLKSLSSMDTAVFDEKDVIC